MSRKLTEERFENLIEKFISNAEEERNLALERYRRQDEMIESPEDFVLQGKNAVDFLKTASERSNSLLVAAKMMKDVLYGNGEGKGKSDNEELTDEMKKEILKQINEDK